MSIRLFKMNKIKMFWIIVLIILGLGNFYFFNYNQPIKESFLSNIQNKITRETRQNMENMKKTRDSFINKAQNEVIKPFL